VTGSAAQGWGPTGSDGLTADQVGQRVAAGLTNAGTTRTSRTIREIVRANVLTFFNGLLGVMLVAVLATGRWQNGLFGLVIVANSGLGIVQELRAKRTLDRLAVLHAPAARVVHDGTIATVEVAAVVQDDLLVLQSGDQVPADGLVLTSTGMEVDEALLTGESEPVAKPREAPCDQVPSSSPARAGSRPPPSVSRPTQPRSRHRPDASRSSTPRSRRARPGSCAASAW